MPSRGASVMDRHRLLIVEDDLATLYALRALFERRGWEVHSARTVGEAMAALEAAVPEWVILDLYLADGDGEEVLRQLRESGRECRVAVTSGVLDPERVARLLEWKADVVMAKPIDFVRLYSACLGIRAALTAPELREVAPVGYPESLRPRMGQWYASTTR